MSTSTVMLILNLAFIAILIVGFLFGLRGAKKSALSLAFFIGALVVTLIITPWVTNALLQISITMEGETMSISQAIIKALQEDPTIKELASSGSNTEALISSMPQLLGNLATYMILLIIVGIVFWIAYLITAHFIFQKEKQNEKALKAKNPISKNAPNNVSATGNITYVKTEPLTRKHRIFGGLIGAVHALVFMIAFLVPVCGTAKLVNQYSYQTEEVSSTFSIGLLDASANTDTDADVDENNYTASAKLLQEKVPAEVLNLVKALDTSIVGNVCGIANTNNIWYNSIAKCNVKGEKIVLSNEMDTVLTIYDNVEFLNNVDYQSAESLRNINFNKLRKAINLLGNSSILKTLTPEIANTYLKWITEDDISSLDPAVQSSLQNVREQLDNEPNLKELVIEIQKMFADDSKTLSTITEELLNLIDTAEIVIKSDLIYDLVKDDVTIFDVAYYLHLHSNRLMDTIIDQLYKSKFVNLTTFTVLNYAIDTLQEEIDKELKDDAVQIGKIVLKDAINNVDIDTMKAIAGFALELYLDLEQYDYLATTQNVFDFIDFHGTTLCTSLSNMLDKIKNLDILQQFNTLPNIVTNLKQIVVSTSGEGENEVKEYVSDYLNLDCLLDSSYSFSNDFEKIIEIINTTKEITFTNEGHTKKYSLLYKMIHNEDLIDVFKQLTKEQISSLITPASEIAFIKPAVTKLIDKLNTSISDSVGEIGEFLPSDIDFSDHIDEIIDVVDDVKQVLPIIDKIDNLDNDKSLAENLTKELTNEEKDAVASLLNTLQDNANNDGVFKETYDTILDTVSNDSKSGLDGLATIVKRNTKTEGETTIIDWQAIINEYLK